MRMLLLLLLVAAPALAFDCPPDQRLPFDPGAWKGTLARDPAAALQTLRMAPLPAPSCTLDGVDDFPVNLSGSPERDRLLQARFSCGDVKAVRIAALAAFAPGQVCLFEARGLDKDGPGCAGQKLPRTFSFKSVVEPGRQTLITRDCGGAVSLWDAQWAVLKKVLTLPDKPTFTPGRSKSGWPRRVSCQGAEYRWHDSPVQAYLPRE